MSPPSFLPRFLLRPRDAATAPRTRPRQGWPLLRQELPWLVAELALLLVLTNANPPELWFWLVVLLVLLAYRVERWWAARPDA